MKSLLLLWKELAEESAGRCCTSATLDVKTVQCRCEHEGLSFLTITLPQYGKDFQKSLDQGAVDRQLFTGFRWIGGLPVFLRGFLDRVFDRSSGRLLDDPCIDSILAIRQLTLLLSKISLECSNTRTRKAMREFIECEQDVRVSDAMRTSSDREDFCRIAEMLFDRVLHEVDCKVYHREEVIPKHGPGVTADKLLGNKKYNQRHWPARLEEEFPAMDFLLPNSGFFPEFGDIDILEPGQEVPVEVRPVPKTLKAPRIIGIEPTAMQYAQQALYPLITDGIRRSDSLRTIIGFTDQTQNQSKALEGSLYGELATLDLSEASDRVSNQLVRDMLAPWPNLNAAVDACRSRKADVPGHGVVRLAKFASMGSALCFPIEAMVFTTLIFLGIERELKRPLRPRDVVHFRSQVRVYGDDIIVPVHYVRSVVHTLQAFGLVVNVNKSFWTGRFRESCGKEYYAGDDVSIVKVRQAFPTRRQDATGVISMISLRNQLYFAGYWETCKWLDKAIRDLIKYFPVVLPSSPVQGRHSFLGYQAEKECRHLRSPIVKGYVVVAKSPQNSLSGPGALLKFFLKRGGEPSVDREHLMRSGRARSVNLRLSWASAI